MELIQERQISGLNAFPDINVNAKQNASDNFEKDTKSICNNYPMLHGSTFFFGKNGLIDISSLNDLSKIMRE